MDLWNRAMFKDLFKQLLPPPIIRFIRMRKNNDYNKLSTEQIFTRIYEKEAWGKSENSDTPFFSGSGSHTNEETGPYVRSVGHFLCSFDVKPDVVDLGCGDFNVGRQLRNSCDRYIACDIVVNLIAFNQRRFKDLRVDFRVLDLVEDELPPGDIVFVRQVLQHLSNDQIRKFIGRVPMSYKFMVATEHWPSLANFKHNVDKPSGPETRMGYGSGIVLTSPPFNLDARVVEQLCCVDSIDGGVLVTTLYGF